VTEVSSSFSSSLHKLFLFGGSRGVKTTKKTGFLISLSESYTLNLVEGQRQGSAVHPEERDILGAHRGF